MVEAANDRLRVREKGLKQYTGNPRLPGFSVQRRAGNASRKPTKDRENFFRWL
jgi:hypothetical protein